MKTNLYSILVLIILFSSCNLKKKSDVQNVSFSLYETLRIVDLPASLFDSIRVSTVKPQYDKGLSVVGYLTKEDFIKFQNEYSRSSIRFLKTVNPVDPEGRYYAVVAVRYPSVIGNADIQNTKDKNTEVVLHFNLSGAKKWAEMTKNNIGNSVAFTIDDQIYSMPVINAEINNGTALIDGFKDPSAARQMAAALNNSLPK